jgi:hypothetical protein
MASQRVCGDGSIPCRSHGRDTQRYYDQVRCFVDIVGKRAGHYPAGGPAGGVREAHRQRTVAAHTTLAARALPSMPRGRWLSPAAWGANDYCWGKRSSGTTSRHHLRSHGGGYGQPSPTEGMPGVVSLLSARILGTSLCSIDSAKVASQMFRTKRWLAPIARLEGMNL